MRGGIHVNFDVSEQFVALIELDATTPQVTVRIVFVAPVREEGGKVVEIRGIAVDTVESHEGADSLIHVLYFWATLSWFSSYFDGSWWQRIHLRLLLLYLALGVVFDYPFLSLSSTSSCCHRFFCFDGVLGSILWLFIVEGFLCFCLQDHQFDGLGFLLCLFRSSVSLQDNFLVSDDQPVVVV